MKKSKKALVAILSLVLVLALSAVAFVGCTKNETPESGAASNSDTLGTAVAVAASMLSDGSGQAAAVSAAEVAQAQAGININGSITGNASIDASISATLQSALEFALETQLDSVKCCLNENSITVEKKETSDDEAFSIQYAITVVSSVGDEAQTTIYNLYFNATKDGEQVSDIESVDTYQLNGKLVYGDGENDYFEFGCDAVVVSGEQVFQIKVSVSENVFVSLNAKATTDGKLNLEVETALGALADARLSITIGTLADGKYGAVVNLDASVLSDLANVNALISISAANAEGDYVLNISGTAEVSLSVLSISYTVAADIDGTATYTADGEFALSANANVSLVNNNSQK